MKRRMWPTFLAVFLLSASATAEDWNEEQQQVIASIKACWTEKEKDEWLACYHEDFVGWYKDSLAPITKADKRASADRWDWSGASYEYELVDFKPFSVYINGDVAVTIYTATSRATVKSTNEVTRATERWTDVSVRIGEKWQSIAEHAEFISTE